MLEVKFRYCKFNDMMLQKKKKKQTRLKISCKERVSCQLLLWKRHVV